jgi:drug/metabolite transporter (DMT)-like permease
MSTGIIAAALVALLWAISSLCFSLAGRSIGSGAVNHVRLWLALVLTAAVSAAASGHLLPALAGARQAAWLAASGLIGYVIGDAFLFEAFVLLGARVTMLVMTSVPIFGAVFGLVVLGERPTPAQLAMMAVTLAGIAVVVGGRERGPAEPAAADRSSARAKVWGLVCAAGGAAGQAGGLLLSKMALQQGVAPFAANTVRLLAGAAAMGVWALARGRVATDFRAAVRRDAGPFVVAGAVSGPVLGVALSLYAVARVDIGVASTMMQMSPIFLLPLSRIVTGDRITVRAIIGTMVAVAGGAGLFLLA